MTTDKSAPQPADLGQVASYMPWVEVFQDMGYPMPYPEVVMAGELAYAQFTQMNSLLMMLSWEGNNQAHYRLEAVEASYEAYRLSVNLQLESISEAWGMIGISDAKLRDYLLQGVALWARHKKLPNSQLKMIRIAPTEWMMTASK
ncbi:hypothetical protein [Porphyromonas sp. COT-290 OH860]|uniref:hypothetical protein n=1 Tax=Porphyromonas sp. COT-290 OH860 TaxID=1515615 RepID=UPI00052E2133|nr:hypothetical protein [Porphyromonas sp. COT-290 OH860]KGN84455.1 hypothetical protein HQ41_04450 [Porphyromonas sp. COT-290 OH860]